MTQCLVRLECLSFGYDASAQNCTLFNMRGNELTHRPASTTVRYRKALGEHNIAPMATNTAAGKMH